MKVLIVKLADNAKNAIVNSFHCVFVRFYVRFIKSETEASKPPLFREPVGLILFFGYSV
jgi:hypothetical protein